jgi:hypothetical protein
MVIEEKYFNKVDFEKNKSLLLLKDKCDKYDYLIAAGCGVLGGVIDIFLVGSPKDSVIGRWTDDQVDSTVKSFAKFVGWSPSKENSIASAIGYLEKKFRINYDQRHTVDVDGVFNMTTKNHHMMSLGHSPDIVGLFFSILNQFTNTSTFIADGKVISISTKSSELQGSNFISKLYCGIVNWFGHIMSDIAGSSGSRGQGGRGTGVVIPFFELIQLCKFGKFNVGKDRQDLATIAIRTFQEGYDFRHGLAMSIPVIFTDLAIKFFWSVRHHYVDKRPLSECVPTARSEKLRIMLLVGSGTLCCLDGIAAGVKSGGNWLVFFTQLNIIAWFRFIQLIMRELGIRFGLSGALERELDAMRRINIALAGYIKEAKQYDINTLLNNVNSFSVLTKKVDRATDEKELCSILVTFCNEKGYELPWRGNFDDFMNDRANRLIFR